MKGYLKAWVELAKAGVNDPRSFMGKCFWWTIGCTAMAILTMISYRIDNTLWHVVSYMYLATILGMCVDMFISAVKFRQAMRAKKSSKDG